MTTNILTDDESAITFLTIVDPNEGFTPDFIREFEDELLQNIDIDCSLEKAFSTRIVFKLEGDREDITESCGIITQLLLLYEIYTFTFTLHTLELNED